MPRAEPVRKNADCGALAASLVCPWSTGDTVVTEGTNPQTHDRSGLEDDNARFRTHRRQKGDTLSAHERSPLRSKKSGLRSFHSLSCGLVVGATPCAVRSPPEGWQSPLAATRSLSH